MHFGRESSDDMAAIRGDAVFSKFYHFNPWTYNNKTTIKVDLEAKIMQSSYFCVIFLVKHKNCYFSRF